MKIVHETCSFFHVWELASFTNRWATIQTLLKFYIFSDLKAKLAKLKLLFIILIQSPNLYIFPPIISKPITTYNNILVIKSIIFNIKSIFTYFQKLHSLDKRFGYAFVNEYYSKLIIISLKLELIYTS